MDIKESEKTKILDIKEENSKIKCKVQTTLFYSGGGGQPADKGILLTANNESANIINIEKNNGDIWLLIDKKIAIEPGMEVMLKLNVERRTKLMKMHSGEHIFFKALQNIKKDIVLDKIDLEEDESSIFVLTDKLDWDSILLAEKTTNDIINKNIEFEEIYVEEKDLDKYPELRIKKERIKDNKIRIIKAGDFDISACKGTHVKNSIEIGNFLVTKLNSIGKKYEIKFKVDVKEELFSLAAQTRKIASLINADVNEIFEKVKTIINEKEKLKEKIRKFSDIIVQNYKEEKINDILFCYEIFEDVEKKKMIDKATELLNTDERKKIIIFINKHDEKNEIFIGCSRNSGTKANELLKIIQNYGGKGGGTDFVAQGSFEGNSQKVLEEIKNKLKA